MRVRFIVFLPSAQVSKLNMGVYRKMYYVNFLKSKPKVPDYGIDSYIIMQLLFTIYNNKLLYKNQTYNDAHVKLSSYLSLKFINCKVLRFSEIALAV